MLVPMVVFKGSVYYRGCNLYGGYQGYAWPLCLQSKAIHRKRDWAGDYFGISMQELH